MLGPGFPIVEKVETLEMGDILISSSSVTNYFDY